jgi:hypothetical protein
MGRIQRDFSAGLLYQFVISRLQILTRTKVLISFLDGGFGEKSAFHAIFVYIDHLCSSWWIIALGLFHDLGLHLAGRADYVGSYFAEFHGVLL